MYAAMEGGELVTEILSHLSRVCTKCPCWFEDPVLIGWSNLAFGCIQLLTMMERTRLEAHSLFVRTRAPGSTQPFEINRCEASAGREESR